MQTACKKCGLKNYFFPRTFTFFSSLLRLFCLNIFYFFHTILNTIYNVERAAHSMASLSIAKYLLYVYCDYKKLKDVMHKG